MPVRARETFVDIMAGIFTYRRANNWQIVKDLLTLTTNGVDNQWNISLRELENYYMATKALISSYIFCKQFGLLKPN